MTRDTDALIEALVARAHPVRRLAPPGWRALGLLTLAGSVLLALVLVRGLRPDLLDCLATTTYVVGVVAALATAIVGTIAALLLAAPDRPRGWIALPLVAAALWLGAVGVGCLRAWVPLAPGMVTATELANCFATVALAATPVSLGLLWQLRRAVPLRPGLPLAAAVLAASGFASVVLSLVHSINASVMILAWNAAIVGALALASTLAARHLPARDPA